MKTFWRRHCYGRNDDLWFVFSSHSTCFLWAFVVVFNDSFNTRDGGYITFTLLLSAVSSLPPIKHLAHRSASIPFATQASVPVLAALICHCWLNYTWRNEECAPTTNTAPFLTTTCVNLWTPRAAYSLDLVWSQLVLMGVVERSYIASFCVGKWPLIIITVTILIYFDNAWCWSDEHECH